MKSKKIKDIKVGDEVLGPNGFVKVEELVKKHIPTRMFNMKFDVGKVKCSGDHLWLVFLDDKEYLLTTIEIFNSKEKEYRFGKKNGPRLLKMKEIPPKPVCCIKVKSEDKLFTINLPKGNILTHNCQFRAACGRLGSVASMMLFGNTMATTIDGSHPGAGMISANGAISSIQYYYEEINWIQKFYKKCGYDKLGHRSVDIGNNQINNEEELSEEDIDSIFDFKHDISKIEIEGISGEVDKTKKQKFEE